MPRAGIQDLERSITITSLRQSGTSSSLHLCHGFGEIVNSSLAGLPGEAITELDTMGVEFFPDVLEWGKNAPNPYQDILVSGHSTIEPTPGTAVEDQQSDEDL
jgi:hypothetical protein